MNLIAIAAVAKNGVIGENGSLPWNIPEDMKRFRAVTMGFPVIMGRKTFESIGGKPLEGRENIVLSKTLRRREVSKEVKIARGVEDVMRLVGKKTAFLIGGQELFERMLYLCDRMWLTEIQREYPAGDVFFPMFDKYTWKETYRSRRTVAILTQPQYGGNPNTPVAFETLEYHFVEYVREEICKQ